MKKACLSSLAKRPAPPSRRHSRLFAAAVGLALVAGGLVAAAEAGASVQPPPPKRAANPYLPVLGPLPLRVSFPAPPGPPPQLPPLAMSDPPPPPEPLPTSGMTNQAVATAAAPPVAPPADALSATGEFPIYGPPPPEANSSLVFDPMLSGAAPAMIVTPQMLVQFFKPVGSNCLGGVWTMPVFVPPDPPAQKSSTASYRSQ